MAYIHAGKNEAFYVGVTIHAGKRETFKLTPSIHAAKQETFKLNKTITSGRKEEFSLLNQSLYSVYSGTEIAGQEWLKYFAPVVIPSVILTSTAGTEDISAAIKKTVLKKHLDGKTMLSLELEQPGFSLADLANAANTGTHDFLDKLLKRQPDSINPFYVGFADPNARLIRHNFTTRTTFQLTYEYGYDQTGYATWPAPTMIPLEPNFDGKTLTLELEDLCGMLEKQNISMTDIDADAPPETKVVHSSHSAIREIIAAHGNFNNTVIQYEPFQIRLLRRKNGVPLNWIDQINRIRQAKRQVRGRTLYIGAVTPPHLGTPKWRFVEGTHIVQGDFSVRQDLSDYKNEFTVSRTSPQGGIIGQQECQGPQCVGRTGNISFDMPVTACGAQVEATNGLLEDFVYKGASGAPVLPDAIYALGPSGTSYLGATPATSVEFTYRASVGVGSFVGAGSPGAYNTTIFGNNAGLFAYTPGYKVTYYGKLDSQVGVSALYNYTAKDTSQQTLFGVWPEYGDIEDPMISDEATMIAYGQALLREATRSMWMITLKTKYVNPAIEPGEIFAIDDYECKMSAVNWLVEDVTITTENGTAMMEITGSRGGV